MTVVLKMGKQRKHHGDAGDWNLGSAEDPVGSIRERMNSAIDLPNSATIPVMLAEQAFVASVADQFPMKRFTDRRTQPDRNHAKPHGADKKADPRMGDYITQRD